MSGPIAQQIKIWRGEFLERLSKATERFDLTVKDRRELAAICYMALRAEAAEAKLAEEKARQTTIARNLRDAWADQVSTLTENLSQKTALIDRQRKTTDYIMRQLWNERAKNWKLSNVLETLIQGIMKWV